MSEDLHRYLRSLVQERMDRDGLNQKQIATRAHVSPSFITQVMKPTMRTLASGKDASYTIRKVEQLAEYLGKDIIDLMAEARAAAPKETRTAPDPAPSRASAIARVGSSVDPEAIRRALELPPDYASDEAGWVRIIYAEHDAIVRERARVATRVAATKESAARDMAETKRKVTAATKRPAKAKRHAS